MFMLTADTKACKAHSAIDLPYKNTEVKPLIKDEREYNHALNRFRLRVTHTP